MNSIGSKMKKIIYFCEVAPEAREALLDDFDTSILTHHFTYKLGCQVRGLHLDEEASLFQLG